MSLEPALADYYARRAREYERIYSRPERQAELARLREFVGGLFTDLDVLEIACGTGFWTEVLARSARTVLAIDVSTEVLAVARSKGLGNHVEFRLGDAYAPPAGGAFRGGLAAFWWSHVPRSEVRRFVINLGRSLAPGAQVVCLDNIYVEGNSTPISRTDACGDTYQVRRLEDGSTHEVRKNFPTEVELRAAVAGLSAEVRVEFLEYYWVLSYRSLGREVRVG